MERVVRLARGKGEWQLRNQIRLAIPAGSLVAALLLATGVSLAADGVKEKGALTLRSKPTITGQEVKRTTDLLLSEVPWHKDLEHALAVAKEENKPVFWLQLVGELDDGL